MKGILMLLGDRLTAGVLPTPDQEEEESHRARGKKRWQKVKHTARVTDGIEQSWTRGRSSEKY